MKTKIFSLFVALFAFVWSATAQENWVASLTIYHGSKGQYGNEHFNNYFFPASGFEEVVYNYPVAWARVRVPKSSIRRIDPLTTVLKFQFHYKIYSTSPNGQISNEEWHTDSIRIVYDDEIYLFPPDQDWVNMETKKTIEFYFEGEDESGHPFLYNNGGKNYKITYDRDEELLRVKHSEAVMNMSFTNTTGDNWDLIQFRTDDGTLSQTKDLGVIYSLKLQLSNISFYYMDSEASQDVSLQYRVYEEGHADESIWNRMDMDLSNKIERLKIANYITADKGLGIDVTEGLEYNKSYVLEMYYDVVQDGVHYVIGSTEKGVGSKIKFCLNEKPQPFKSVSLGYSINGGDPEMLMLPPSGYPVTVIDEPVSSFEIYGSEIMAEEVILSLTMYISLLEDNNNVPINDDMPMEESRFETPFTNYGSGIWINELYEPLELMQTQWKQEKKQITVRIYFEGYDVYGNVFHYNNGGKDYKFTWICGEDGGGDTPYEGLKELVLTVNVNGEVIPIGVPYSESATQDMVVPFKLNMFKVMRAEVETDKPMKNVSLNTKVYDSGKPNSVDWETLELAKSGNTWTAEYPYGKELIPEEWLGKNYTKVYEFYVSAENGEGNTVYLNNLGLNYRIIFPVDDADGILAPSDAPEAGWDIYGTDGRRRNATQRGINILRQRDGHVRKVMVRR